MDNRQSIMIDLQSLTPPHAKILGAYLKSLTVSTEKKVTALKRNTLIHFEESDENNFPSFQLTHDIILGDDSNNNRNTYPVMQTVSIHQGGEFYRKIRSVIGSVTINEQGEAQFNPSEPPFLGSEFTSTLRSPTNSVRLINPHQLSEQDAKIVGQFLTENHSTPFFKKHVLFSIKNTEGQEDYFELTHSLIKDSKISRENTSQLINTYDVVSSALGKGSFNKVNKSEGYLAITNGLATFHPQELVVRTSIKTAEEKALNKKIEQTDNNNSSNKSRPEFPHLEEKFLFVKEISESNNGTVSEKAKKYTRMKYFSGVNFEQAFLILLDDETGKYPTKQFIDLCCAFLQAYKSQISDLGYAHRDIKPENVIVNLETSPPTVTFIDLDDAKSYGKKDGFFGSPGFICPALFPNNDSPLLSPRRSVTHKRDIFAIGIMLILATNFSHHPHIVFDDKKAIGKEKNMAVNNRVFDLVTGADYYDTETLLKLSLPNSVESTTLSTSLPESPRLQSLLKLSSSIDSSIDPDTDERSLNYLFAIQDGLTEEHQKSLKNILSSMTHKDPEKRPTIDQVISVYQKIKSDLEESFSKKQSLR